MSKAQMPLQMEVIEAMDFADFIGHEDIVSTLKDRSNLASFCYLWGAQYSGKTHLLSAFSQQQQQQGDLGSVFSAAVLMDMDLSEFIQHQWSYLALDGIEQLAGHNDGERHLFNVFNACKAANVTLLVTADISPRSRQWQLPDLISRLQSGLTLELSPLSGQFALTLFRRQFRNRGIPIEETVLKYIESRYPTDYVSLHKLLIQLDNHSLRDKRKITVPFVKHVLAEN